MNLVFPSEPYNESKNKPFARKMFAQNKMSSFEKLSERNISV